MSAIIKTLKTTTNDVEQSVYPKTVLEAVVDTDTNQTLDVILDNIKSDTPNGSAYVDFNEQSGEVTGEVEAVTSAKLVSYSNTESGIEATNVQDAIDTVSSISKGKNRARVFATTEDMNNWLKNEANKGIANVGDNLYIVELDVPDWWISEVLEEADADTGFYYKIAQLETQKVDLTNIESSISNIETRLITGASLVNHDFNDLGDKPLIGIGNNMTNDPIGNTAVRYHVVHIPAYNNYETVQYAKPINYGSGTLLFFRQQKHDGTWSEWCRVVISTELIAMRSSQIFTYLTDDPSGTITVPANTATKLGSFTIPAKCIATIMFRANNRTVNPTLVFGSGNTETLTSLNWNSPHTSMTQFYTASDTWLQYNNTDSDMTIYVYCKSSIETILQYISVTAICTPIFE